MLAKSFVWSAVEMELRHDRRRHSRLDLTCKRSRTGALVHEIDARSCFRAPGDLAIASSTGDFGAFPALHPRSGSNAALKGKRPF